LILERQGQFRAHLTNANRHLVSRKKGIAMPNSSPLAATQPLEAAASINRFQRRLAICLVLTVLNAIVVTNFIGPLYRATIHDALQQIGVTSLFAALVGSLTRMWFLTLTSRPR
jgi:predicted acyltransferase